jgi:pimeloyl-ACP methyl ester carboxylesterase
LKNSTDSFFGIMLILLFYLVFIPDYAHCECVILLHGLARSDSSMEELEEALKKEKFNTVNVKYASRNYPIQVLAEKAISPAIESCGNENAINFVTHSMGGILVRQYLFNHQVPRLNHVVMLGPPNKGSEVVDKLREYPGFHFVNGHAGMQLGTGEFSIPNKLGKANFDVGIIAGTRSINWILSLLIPNTDDGKVSIERTKLDGMNDHIKMPVTHPFMMKNQKVISQVIYYLKNGKFKR